MIKKTIALSAAMLLGLPVVSAKTEANDAMVKNYMRSSLYTILLNSNKQNKEFYKEAQDAMNAVNSDAGIGAIKAVKSLGKDDKNGGVANAEIDENLFSLPSQLFPGIAIPAQFNDHNLADRVLDFDAIAAQVSDSERDAANPQTKNSKVGGLAKKGLGGVMGAAGGKEGSAMLKVDSVDLYVPAVLNRYFKASSTAPGLLAKWYNYDANNANEHWNLNLVAERGNQNFTADQLAQAAKDQALQTKISNTGFNLIDNTFVVATNLRFRSYQAVVQEAAAMAKAAGSMFGGVGALAAQAASSAATAAVGDGYTVQAVSYLYKLKWNNDLNNQFAENVFAKNASLEDLIASGMCELEFVGKDKASANVRQSILSDKPMSDLVARATTRAIDASIAKLQGKHEVFRTVTPIIGGDGNGTLYAAIGTKEGLGEKDEYEILEAQEDENGVVTYKAVGTVKPVKGKIWNNVYGAEDEAAENKAKAEAKSKDFDDSAVSLGHSEFQGKKGDYTGYFLRLKKKK